jgi:hypothetical protein
MELDGGTPSPEDRKILTYAAICRTELCIWFGTGRAITMVDGVVYERPSGGRGQAKQFPILTPDQLAFGQRNVEDAVQRDLRDSETPKGPQD